MNAKYTNGGHGKKAGEIQHCIGRIHLIRFGGNDVLGVSVFLVSVFLLFNFDMGKTNIAKCKRGETDKTGIFLSRKTYCLKKNNY